MNNEQTFQQSIDAAPYDVSRRLVYADWLEERGDPRAVEIRSQCQFRQPFTAKELRFLPAVAKARRELTETIEIDIDRKYSFHGNGSEDLAVDVEMVNPDRLLRSFPRDDRGNLELKQIVLLSEHNCRQALKGGRNLFLVAASPEKRKDKQVVSVRLEPVIAVNHRLNWSDRRWLWTSLDSGEADRWGIPKGCVDHMPFGTSPDSVTDDSEEDRVCRSVLLLDAGRFEEAFTLFGVEVSDGVSRMLNGEEFQLSGGCDCMYEGAATARASRLRRELWESAPWLLPSALLHEEERLETWRAEKSGRPSKDAEMRLFILPRQRHSQRATLMLVRGKNGPRLEIRWSGSNAVPHDHLWKRSVELDLIRFGLETP